MADVFTKAKRSEIMSRVKGRNTGPELALRKALRKAGLGGYCLKNRLPGSPDLAFSAERLAVFVDGGFWHGYKFGEWKHTS